VRRACTAATVAFGLLYALALGMFLTGTFGLFGAERDPLAGVFLLPLGLPWVFLLDGLPEPVLPWVASLAPAVNLLLLRVLCRALARPTN
jgi:hypothetical protein